jgi:ribosomal protein L7/L12
MVHCMFCDHDNPPGLRRCRNCGADLPETTAPLMPIDDDLESRVRSLMDEGQKIEAIKLYRERTGAGLKDSKDAVEAIGRGQGPPSRQDDRDFRDEVLSLLEQGQKIGAIKLFRERTGVGLKEAKDAVEAMQRGQATPSGAPIGRDFEHEVIALLEQGQKIGAIRLFRERTGAGLKESKDAVETLAERRGIIISQGTGCFGVVVVALGFMAGALVFADDRPTTISEAQRDQDGLLVHTVESPYQSGKTETRVLLSDKLEKDVRYPVVYVLPVEARTGDRYGDGLLEVKRHDLHNRSRAIFVAPTFSHLPWYADHPTNPDIRQEGYFLKVVVPFIEEQYPARSDRDGRFLLGFSKSGWGAFSLLLRHPDRFGKAAAWDAPLIQGRPDRYGMGEIFGTPENFEEYRITRLLDRRAADLHGEARLILLGHGNFRDHHEQVHAQMVDLEVPHVYRDGPEREHDWESGWVPETVGLLLDGEGENR